MLKAIFFLGGVEGVSIRHGAFTRREHLMQTLYLEGHLLDMRHLFESGRLLDHLWYVHLNILVSCKFDSF